MPKVRGGGRDPQGIHPRREDSGRRDGSGVEILHHNSRTTVPQPHVSRKGLRPEDGDGRRESVIVNHSSKIPTGRHKSTSNAWRDQANQMDHCQEEPRQLHRPKLDHCRKRLGTSRRLIWLTAGNTSATPNLAKSITDGSLPGGTTATPYAKTGSLPETPRHLQTTHLAHCRKHLGNTKLGKVDY